MAFLNTHYLHSAIGTRIKVFSILSVVLALIVGVQIVRIDINSKILSVVSRASYSYSFSAIIVFLIIFALGILLLIYNVILGKLRTAVGLYVLFLPLMSLFRRVGGVTIPSPEGGDPILVSFSTFLLFLLVTVFMSRGIRMRNLEDSTFRLFEKLIWLYALTGSAVQLFHHSLFDAFWVSVDGLWQFVLLFYLINAVVKSTEDLRYFFVLIVGSLFFGFVLTLVNERYFQAYISTNYAMRFIFSTSSAGAVSLSSIMGMVLTLYLARATPFGWKRMFYLTMVIALLGLALLTQTRSGIIVLFWLGLLLLYKSERRWLALILAIVLLCGSLIQEKLFTILSYRPLAANLMSIDSVSGRLEVWRLSIPVTFDRAWLGFGIGKTPLIAYIQGMFVNSHNLIFYLIQDVGIIAATVFLSLFSITIWQLLKVSLSKSSNLHQGNIAAYIMIALIMWFSFSVTGGLSITTHVWSGNHEEDTMLFYTFLFLGWATIRLARAKGSVAVGEIKK